MGKKRVGLKVRNAEALLGNAKRYYDLSVGVLQDFGGPSVYFHQEAITAQRVDFLGDRHLEMIYATLASWGMHRMGDPADTKAKMVEFDDFRSSILVCKTMLTDLKHEQIANVTPARYDAILQELGDVYRRLKVSISGSTLVAHSKTLAHILPNLIPPIDRQYTVRFFTQDKSEFFTKNKSGNWNYRSVQLEKGQEEHFTLFANICKEMKSLFDQIDKTLLHVNGCGFNTSHPKIIDNMIMTYVKSIPRPECNLDNTFNTSRNGENL